MCLKRLDIQGFKSFAEKVKLEFNTGLTVVVGPNGSGKSNISDAICWALGEQRPSTLRGAKMEDIIFAGSERRRGINFAEVSLTFDNSAGLFPLSYNEVAITRRIFRSGESEYLINKVPCRLKDIYGLLMDTGIGRGAYAVIGQGKVEDILSGRPEEKRGVVEEAAGIVKYRTRKEEAVRKLAATDQDLARLGDILAEIETQLAPLLAQAEKARVYNRYRKEQEQLELALLKSGLTDLQQKITNIKNSLAEEGNAGEEDSLKLVNQLNEGKLQLGVTDQQLNDLRDRQYRLDQEFERLKGEKNLNQEKLRVNEVEQAQLTDEIERLNDQLKVLAREIEQESSTLNNLQQKDREVSAGGNEASELQQLDQLLAAQEHQLETLKADLIDLMNQAAQARALKQKSAGRREQALIRLEHLQRLAREAGEQETVQQQKNAAATAALAAIKQEQLAVEQQLTDLKNELQGLELEQRKLSQSLNQAKDQLLTKKSRLQVLVETHQTHAGYQRGVRAILSAGRAKESPLAGIHGTVAELIQVPARFELAIEVALGGALQNVVTENNLVAKNCIEYLKRNHLGRVTFLPLEAIKPAYPRDYELAAANLTGVVGFAAGLVSAANTYQKVLALLLGRLLVVETLDQAMAAARQTHQRVRLVTLTGELLNPGGAVTGGSMNKGNGGLLRSRREQEELTAEVDRYNRTVADWQGQLAALGQRIDQLNTLVRERQNRLVHLAADGQARGRELADWQEQAARAVRRREESQWEINNLEQEIEQHAGQEQQAGQELLRQEAALKQVQDEIDQAGGQLADQRQKRDRLEEQVNRLRVEQAQRQQEELGLKKMIGKLRQELNQACGQAERDNSKLAGLMAAGDSLLAAQRELTDQLSALSARREKLVEEQALVTENREKIGRQVQQLEQLTGQIAAEAAKRQARRHALELQEARLTADYEGLLRRLFDDYGLTGPEAIPPAPPMNMREARSRISELKSLIAEMGNINLNAEEEYGQLQERYGFLQAQQLDLQQAKDSLAKLIVEVEQIMAQQFEAAFKTINDNFNEVFRELFGGGSAAMRLSGADLLTCGIEIQAQPPGKKPQQLSLLSGGEKALTAIALLFGIMKYKPSPFCILDEIEAALDETNVDRFARFLHRLADHLQFIVISHRKGTMEKADQLYGVTMDEAGVSRVLSMRLNEEDHSAELPA